MKMRNKYFVIVLILVSTLFIYNCSEVKDDISQPVQLEGIHPDGFAKLGSADFHSTIIQENNWDMTSCKNCHAADFSGGNTGSSCLDCHTGNAGPESCNTCHGVFADETKIAPPTDLNNNYQTSARGVGAHTSHVYENGISLGIGCYECHSGDDTEGNYVTTHIDGNGAAMSIDGYDRNSMSCSNTYCHGNFKFNKVDSENQYAYTGSEMTGNNFTPVWNIVDDTQAACGTCHGEVDASGNLITPQPNGHFNTNEGKFTIAQCPICHEAAFNEDGSLNKFVHLNGKADVN